MERVEIGDAVLFCGDAAEALETMGPGSFDIVITDPPYSSGARRDAERQVRGAMLRSMEDADWFSHDAMTTWGFNWFIRSTFTAIRSHLAPGSHAYVFIDWRQTPNVYGMLEACGFRVNNCLVWDKGHFGMGAYWRNQHEHIVFASVGTASEMLDKGMGTVLTHPIVSASSRVHPTEKPVGLVQAIIEAVPGKTVFDPFMGSGSHGVAAVRAGRRFVGVEINPQHFATACKRIEAAQRQADLFVAPPASKPVQQALFGGEAA
ncbi:site-specific DNA-methyltransferase [Azospirillum sp. TSA2s]|uniref:DNA-methyltransferase n=1 Tax=Azospirillum sp. TSA2s TaxID=709810 RepID=UPI0010AAACE7|nr:site-specific DNA-methyltransferase [Azospirillum sp. TSA2s]QCG93929.1 site-specific DNA-methyltransferase [Azospirillum sp. TSA2s]